jgi:glucose/arabinose dehydrogenase
MFGLVGCGGEVESDALGEAQAALALPSGFTGDTFVSGIAHPTAMAFAPDGRLFVTQQNGQVRVIKNGTLLATPFTIISALTGGERGLLGVALDPSFSSNGFVYVYYTTATPTVHNRVSRFTANGDVAVSGSEVVLMELENLVANNHNGGALHFGPDGKLYIAVGENSNSANSQTLANRLGKLLRINPDGSIPSDNPFFTSASGANRSIWSLGLRNPFTFSFQPGTGRLFINDVGQSAWEEIDEGFAGANYGWPSTEGATTDPRFRGPVFAYPHGSGDSSGCAITGGTFYNPATTQFPTSYVGKYFFSDYCNDWIRVFDPATGTAQAFATGVLAPVDLQVGPEGSLYYLTYEPGAVGRVRATSGLTAQYFDNVDFTNLKLTRIDPSVNFDWGWGSPDPLIAGDTYSVRWTGSFTPEFSEAYTLYTSSDDGIRVKLNGVTVINNFTDHAPTQNTYTTNVLSAGTSYPIQIECYERTGGAVAKLSWTCPTQPKQLVPTTRYRP